MGRKPGGPWYRTSHRAWYAKIGGRQVRLATDHETAQARFRELTEPADVVTVKALVDRFLAEAGGRVRPNTLRNYQQHCGSFREIAGGLPAADVRPLHVTAWIATRPRLSSSTRTLAVRQVKVLWSWAEREGYLAANPLRQIKTAPIPRRAIPLESELARWQAAVDWECVREWVDIALATGMRPGEQCGVTAKDLHEDHRAILVDGKTGLRLVFLGQAVRTRLEELAANRPTGPLLRSLYGKAWNVNNLDGAFQRVSRRAGVRVTPHMLRHVFGTRLHRRGVDILTIKELMGHSSIKMTADYYVEADPATLLAALDMAV